MRGLLAVLVLLAPGIGLAEQADSCAALARRDFGAIPDAATTILAAAIVPAAEGLPAYCRVQGYVAPQVIFELDLPLGTGWNGKFLMQGCGGLCGQVQPATCDDALARGYAVIVTDMGHAGSPVQALWAYNNLPAEIDFAYRSTHVVAVAGKAITRTFYDRAPSRSYFRGCSTGGRQAMVEAQRFPADFDGIIAGAPVWSETGISALHLIWSSRANLAPAGGQILTPEAVDLVHRAVLAACDARDGLTDGIIEDPSRCPFDPASLRCSGDAAACLTPVQVGAVRRFYGGATDSTGRHLTPGGLAPGSEHEWVPNFVGRNGAASVFAPDGPASALFRYLIFMPDPGPGYSAAEFDFDRDPPRLALMESLYTPLNPDLRGFRNGGGRLILYQGWNDAEIPPSHTIDYYETAERTMGGRAATREFFRLFMVPGMAHCRRGPGADSTDWLGYLETWVEQGRAPDEVLAYHMKKEQNYLGLPRLRFPLPAADYDRVRPLYPWPGTARYRGRGDPADGSGWTRGAAPR